MCVYVCTNIHVCVYIALQVGIRVFVTGGIGGVHRGFEEGDRPLAPPGRLVH